MLSILDDLKKPQGSFIPLDFLNEEIQYHCPWQTKFASGKFNTTCIPVGLQQAQGNIYDLRIEEESMT